MEKPFISKAAVILCLVQLLLFLEVSSDTELLSFEYLDKDFNVLSLRCHGDCTAQAQASSIMSIVITNSTSQALVAIVRSAQSPVVKSFLQDVVYYVGGALTPDQKSCSLEVIIKNCKILARLEFKCVVTTSLRNGSIITRSGELKVDKRVLPKFSSALHNATHNMCTATHVMFIVDTCALFLVAIFFLSLWLRARNSAIPDDNSVNVAYAQPQDAL